VTKPDRRIKGREQGEERGAAGGKALSGQWVNPDKGREKVETAKAVPDEKEKNRDNNLIEKGE
jgi:hypothetical protein